MAPRTSKSKNDDASTTSSDAVLKPKTEKAKVSKAKADKSAGPKTAAAAAIKGKAAAAAEKKVEKGGAKGEKEKEKVEKVKAVTGDAAVQIIVEYLKAQNRPFSATEVSANLHGKVTKTVADKILKELGEKKSICMNSTNSDKKGSQFVFWTLQDPADAASAEDLALMDSTITSLRASNPSLKSALKIATTKLSTLKSAPTTPELQTMVQALHRENASKAEKLEGFKSGQVKQVSKEEAARVEKEFRYWGTKKKARRAMYEGLEDMLINSGMARDELREKIGWEAEEE